MLHLRARHHPSQASAIWLEETTVKALHERDGGENPQMRWTDAAGDLSRVVGTDNVLLVTGGADAPSGGRTGYENDRAIKSVMNVAAVTRHNCNFPRFHVTMRN